jgi:hypothetical protein
VVLPSNAIGYKTATGTSLNTIQIQFFCQRQNVIGIIVRLLWQDEKGATSKTTETQSMPTVQ